MPKTLHLLEMKVGRDAEGAYLAIRSDVTWTMLRSASPPPATPPVLGMVETDLINIVQVPGITVTNDLSSPKLFIGDKPNVAFLGARKLKDGVTFRLVGPVSTERMKAYTTALRAYVRGLYAEHLKPVDFTCIVTVTETEKL